MDFATQEDDSILKCNVQLSSGAGEVRPEPGGQVVGALGAVEQPPLLHRLSPWGTLNVYLLDNQSRTIFL